MVPILIFCKLVFVFRGVYIACGKPVTHNQKKKLEEILSFTARGDPGPTFI
ncbi:hypothetical protein ES703_01902 [subsurface metagenome]